LYHFEVCSNCLHDITDHIGQVMIIYVVATAMYQQEPKTEILNHCVSRCHQIR